MKRLTALSIITFLILVSCTLFRSAKESNPVGSSYAVLSPANVMVHKRATLEADYFKITKPDVFVVTEVVRGKEWSAAEYWALGFGKEPYVTFFKVEFDSGARGYINGEYFYPRVSPYILSESEAVIKFNTTPRGYLLKEEAILLRKEKEIVDLELERVRTIKRSQWTEETKEKMILRRIEPGMVSAQVSLSLGSPEKIIKLSGAEGKSEQWHYTNAVFNFKDDRLVSLERVIWNTGSGEKR